MKKIYLLIFIVFLTDLHCFAQFDVPNYGDIGPAGSGSWLRFTTGGDPTSIQEFYGLNLYGQFNQPVKILNTSLLVGYQSDGDSPSFAQGNALISGRIGIGTLDPNAALDVRGIIVSGSGLGNIDPNNSPLGDISFLANSAKMLVGWNRTSGQGETAFLANRANGSEGGFAFYDYGNDNSENQLLRIMGNGAVGIGTSNPDANFKLSVNGVIRSKEIKVEANWSDYVFKKAYKLRTLPEVESYVLKQGHLPDVPSQAEVKRNGVNVGEVESTLLRKVEELTLYLIEKDKQLKGQQVEILGLKKQINSIVKRLK